MCPPMQIFKHQRQKAYGYPNNKEVIVCWYTIAWAEVCMVCLLYQHIVCIVYMHIMNFHNRSSVACGR